MIRIIGLGLIVALLFILVLVFSSPIYAIDIVLSNPLVNSDEEVAVDISVTGLSQNSCPNTKCYLQGMFTQPDQTPQYFGYTLNNYGDWYEYNGSPDKNFIQTEFFNFEPLQGSWSGQIKFKNNRLDTDYKGPGDYLLRVRRYTGNSTSSTSETSNDLSVHLVYVLPTPTPTENPEPTNTSTPTLTPTPTSTKTPTPTPSKSPTPTPVKTFTPVPSPSETQVEVMSGEPGEILGTTDAAFNSSSSPKSALSSGSKNKNATVAIILVGLGIALIGVSIYLALKTSKSSGTQNDI